MSAPRSESSTAVIKLLASLNELNIRAFSSKTRDSLIFLILNDTVQVVGYDRAFLFQMDLRTPKLLGVSGHTSTSSDSELLKDVTALVGKLSNPHQTQTLEQASFRSSQDLFLKDKRNHPERVILWVPIIHEGKFYLGLWLERWKNIPWKEEETRVLTFLSRGYGVAWQKFASNWHFPKISKSVYGLILAATFLLAFGVRVPLRVVAPCEVVASDPLLITAPLDGIVEEMQVKPGQEVKKGENLFVYDKRVPLQELKVAEKEVDIAASQLNRALTLGIKDPKSLNESAIWDLQLQREKIKLDLAKYRASQLEVRAPDAGVAVFDNPDEWRGKPVTIGERVLVLITPEKTKVKIWLPEGDNIPVDMKKPVKIFLNIDPATSYAATLVYISDYSALSEKGVPSFHAEATWAEPVTDVKVGLKGSAVLYGANVSLFYWVMRKPWNSLRTLTGF